MLLKRFYLNLIVRLALILVTMVFQAFAIQNLFGGQLLFTFIVLTGILILQLVLLFLYVKKSNRQLTRLVLSLSNQDFTQTLAESASPHKEFKQALNAIVEQFQSVYMEKESQAFLMHQLVRSIPAGIMVSDPDGKLILKNQAIEQLLGLSGTVTLKEIKVCQPELYKKIFKPGNPGDYTYQLSTSNSQKNLAITIKLFLLLKREHKIFLIQDISKEVDAAEIDAMQRLLRILTHEIMNSLTPVHSLTETITMLMTDSDGQARKQEQLSQKNYRDILESVLAIQERTSGLDHFVSRFRTLTRMPEKLVCNRLKVRELLEAVCTIMQTQLSGVKVDLKIASEDLAISVDGALIEQVLINLITNALTAMAETEHPRLGLKAFTADSHIVVQVSDNGTGIPKEKLADIFLPFYSTKEQASGIGLSFVKQVLRLHNASIQVQSVVNQGSTFSMRFSEWHADSNTDQA